MRLGSLLSVLAFRVPLRKVNAKTFILFVEHLTILVREQRLILHAHPKHWGSQILSFLGKEIPVQLEERVWKMTKGGFGARDIWDLLNSCLSNVKKEENTEKKDSKLFSLFVILSLLPEVVKGLLGGNYGDSVSKTLYKVLLIHIPETLENHNNDPKTMFHSFGKFILRFKNNTRKRVLQYLKTISACIRLGRQKVYNVVYKDFCIWKGIPVGDKLFTIEYIEKTMVNDLEIEAYLTECTENEKIELRIKEKVYTIPVSKNVEFHSSSMERIIDQCASPLELPTAKSTLESMSMACREAEFNWEHKDF